MQFGVSPGLTDELIQAARDVSFPLLPGVMTPAEMIKARLHGFTALKLFPAMQAGGIGMLKAVFKDASTLKGLKAVFSFIASAVLLFVRGLVETEK